MVHSHLCMNKRRSSHLKAMCLERRKDQLSLSIQLIIISRQWANRSVGRTFLRRSAGLSSVCTWTSLMLLLSSTYLIRRYFTRMCFVYAWKKGFGASIIALWLSQWKTGKSVMPRPPTRWEIYKASSHTSVSATYSSSVVDNATHFCSLEIYRTASTVKVKTYLEVNFV